MKMKRFFLPLTLLALVLSGCTRTTANPSQDVKTPEEITQNFVSAIQSARSEADNTNYPLITTSGDQYADEIFPLLGVTADDMTSYAISISSVNTNAYAIALIRPAADKNDTVKKGLDSYVSSQKQTYQDNGADQYDIANAAKVEKLSDGTYLLVMCDKSDDVAKSIKTNLGV
ncbi:MAG: DUF4358 domain-containing protein [Intestinimonas sp.]|jgi:hypothetical protein|nr:DUF4358 domain-containing protein [Intestinimonas sp.]